MQVSATGAKQGRVPAGFKLRYYKYDEFKKLSKEQHDEILEYHKYQKNDGKIKKYDQGNSKK